MDEQLVETHPRDALLVSRQKNLEIKKVKERKKALINARANYHSWLKQFAQKFLASENFPSDPAQKEELAKIYVSRCKKEISLISGLLAAGHYGFWWAAVNYSPYLLAALPLVLFFTIAGVIIIVENISFLRARKLLKTASEEELKSLDSSEKIPARDSHFYNSPTDRLI